LEFLGKHFGYAALLDIWEWVRFAILFLLLLVIIYFDLPGDRAEGDEKSPAMPGCVDCVGAARGRPVLCFRG
jgi:hypothetical protein